MVATIVEGEVEADRKSGDPRVRRHPTAVVGILLALSSGVLSASPAHAAVTSSVNNGVLTVSGDGNDDVITIQCLGGNVDLNGHNPDTGPTACSSITAIKVGSGGGNDAVSVSAVSRSVFNSLTDVTIHGGGDNDSIFGSPDADALFGDGGSDTFYLVQGDDTIEGGTEGDRLTLSTNHDLVLTPSRLTTGDDDIAIASIEAVDLTSVGRGVRFDARQFHDDLFVTTDRGDDVLLGGTGSDRMSSGGGSDRLVGGRGTDYLVGGRGNDVLLGGPEVNYVDGSEGHDRCRGGGVITNCES
jgi:Ca2+-binding RTX toxin-like protein